MFSPTTFSFLLKIFKDHAIDGETLPLLTEEHLLETMGLKLGPALKIRSQVQPVDIVKIKILNERCVLENVCMPNIFTLLLWLVLSSLPDPK